MTMTFLMSCQDEVFEVEPPSSDQALLADGELQNNLLQVALLDGSFDNVIDNSSCFTVLLPVQVSVIGESRSLSTKQDIKDLEKFFENRVRNREYLQLEYPLTLISSDYQRFTVSERTELENLTAQCIEGGQDIDNECIDFSYPVSLSTYDLINQKAGIISIGDDEFLYNALQNKNPNYLYSVNYPVQLLEDGEVKMINDNMELLSLLAGTGAECDERDEPFYVETSLKVGNLSLSLTDAPYPVGLLEEANITISRIELEQNFDDNSDRIIEVSNDTVEVNLLELNNGITTDLVNIDISVGTYDAIYLYISEASVLLTDGRVFDLKVPSSRIKIKNGESGIEISPGANTEMLADFNVSSSFVIQGNPNTPAGIRGFIFKPVINLSNLKESGSIGGAVFNTEGDILEDVEITLIAADTIYTTTFSNEDGNYKFLGIPEGSFALQAALEGYQEVVIENVEVEVQEETVQDISMNDD